MTNGINQASSNLNGKPLQEIEKRLKNIDDSLKTSKLQPFLLAAFVALATTISTCVTNRKQEQVKNTLVQSFERYGELGKQTAQEQMAFVKRANELLSKIDDAFNEICYLQPTTKAEKKISESLEQYRKLLDQASTQVVSESIKTAMKKYSDLLIENLRKIRGGITNQRKSNFYKGSRKFLEEARQQANEVIVIK
jgi:hypothetical protein